jgi:hypothetical protein
MLQNLPLPKLTKSQKRFLLSYAEEFAASELDGDRDSFITRCEMADFDGDATTAEIKVALNLQAMGLLKDVTPHKPYGLPDSAPNTLLSVEFTAAGGAAIYDLAQLAKKSQPKPEVMQVG